ncbi:carbohydrate kinase family protein [Modestobacter sp. I12A-02628]|uniref:Carbohydrate kinase family protein n=1 Tax=Goekera deserti TaxID=2497753 RepID=A0A7K3WBS4_9ACTN|nr:carbohydrate kinase family protein [Goekera deserti]MPQ97695.1 carbohydrate kinase family protein [Goekera deserti]NDI47638.1 carbohydrate kinase family protein [Goekera deserti]NDI47701.1 carbohydrate kinase family protein [Goekera deserti]NEL53449.1 carbohydrate kinase family protein [Goekera deserti]
MPVAVTGSIATDHLMTFPGKFTDQFVEGQMENVSLSFLVDDLVQHRGGAGANIAYGLGLLGLAPVLVGAVGSDFADYDSWLSRHGVDTGSVHWSEVKHTSRFVCTTDAANNQIASFYSGAMAEASMIELAPVEKRVGSLDLVVVGPNDPTAMVQHTRECLERGYPFMADPSQQLAWADGEMVRTLVDGADLLFTNEYEAGLLLQKTGWTADEVLAKVGTWVTTRAAHGTMVRRAGEETIEVIAVPETKTVEPTGGGDALRAGFIAARQWGLGLERATQVGSAVATEAIEVVGTQEYSLPRGPFLERFAAAFGADAADEVAPHLP